MWFILILVGVAAGISAGLFGIGGGVILVPAMTFLLGYSQYTANGTSLVALLAPVGFLGVVEYYRSGKIGPENVKAGLIIAIGMFVGTLFGSRLAISLSPVGLRRCFAVFLVFVAVRLWLKK